MAGGKKVLLELDQVSKIYSIGEHKVAALVDITLKIREGEFVSISGPSGSGKSTLMHLIGLLDTPTSGRIIFQGEDVSEFSENQLAHLRNKEIGFVFQQFNLLARTSALDNVMLPLVYSGIKEQEMLSRAEKALELVGLGDRLNHHPNQLSGGQQQRVAIARALVNNPSIILADEPTGNLDSKVGSEILLVFKKLHKIGKTVVLVTHETYVAKQAERVIRIKDGKIAF